MPKDKAHGQDCVAVAEPDEAEGEYTATAGTASQPASNLLKYTQDLQQLGQAQPGWMDEDEEGKEGMGMRRGRREWGSMLIRSSRRSIGGEALVYRR
eukprot:1146498-Pelagomonas_calceolata.AAC.6